MVNDSGNSGRRDRGAGSDKDTNREAKAPNPFRKRFKDYARIIDDKNDKHERFVKASRDITMQSKKIIFGLHRLSDDNKKETIEKAHTAAAKVRREIATRIAPDLPPPQYYRFHRAFSPGMQEYVEARTFLSYCEHGALISLAEMEDEIGQAIESAEEAKSASIQSAPTEPAPDTPTAQPGANATVSQPRFAVDGGDYVLGVADLTGELMRMALGGASANGTAIHAAMRDLEACMAELAERHRVGRDMPGKLRVLRQSVVKVERSCYDRSVRGAEFGGKEGVKRGAIEAP